MYIYAKWILNFFDHFTKKKIINILKKILQNQILVVVDVGAYHGTMIKTLLKNFKINTIYGFEPNYESFIKLQKNINKIKIGSKIKIYNFGIGLKDEEKLLKETLDQSSSTINELNINSNYYKKKIKYLYHKKEQPFFNKKKIIIKNLGDFLNNNRIEYIDLLKIDTEGYEYKTLISLGEKIKKIKVVHFEHHYDDMIIKNYTFSDINNLLLKNNFRQVFKTKMYFRKSFEYVYVNNLFQKKINK